MATLHGTLRYPGAGAWDGYRATAAWSERQDSQGDVVARFRAVGVDTKGAFDLDLPPAASTTGGIDLAVNAPTGELVLRTRLDPPAADLTITLDTTGYIPPVVADSATPPGAGQRPLLQGRALGVDGTPARAGESVVLWGVAVGAQSAYPFLVTQLQVGGYFSGDRPTTEFASAYGTVAGGKAISLALDDGLVPETVLLVGDVPVGEAPPSDCDCAVPSPPRLAGHAELTANPESFSSDLGGQCVDLTIPNRALEEVTWHTIVRTSEPTVQGISLPDDHPLPPAIVDGLRQIVNLEPTRMARVVGEAAAPALALPANLILDARQASKVVRTGEPLEPATLVEADLASRFRRARDLLRAPTAAATRPVMDGANRADWDETPTLYQATSIAHGHVLTFRQTWHADGYSLGDLLYSLPLAPGQKRQIATVDWDRSDTVLRLAERDEREMLSALIEHDRDINEIVRGALDEHVRAGSSATRGAVGGGFGLAIGPLVIGGAGGSAWASSSAWQNSARDVAGQSLQQIRDRTIQSARATRSQRSTVVQAVRQGESMRAEATTVANYNHCHAMTVEYFEVLRHFQLTHEIVGVRECLLVPFAVSEFDLEKALRWREPLAAVLRRRDLAAAFDAAQRVRTNWVDTPTPVAAFADETLSWLDGELYVRIDLPRPKDTADDLFDAATWVPYAQLLTRSPEEEWKLWLGGIAPAERDGVWAKRIAPRIARKLLDPLQLAYLDAGGGSHAIAIDATLVSTWRAGATQLLTVRPRVALPAVHRADIASLVFSSGAVVPSVANVVIERGSMRYRTAFMHHAFFTDRLIENDLATGDNVQVTVPLDAEEKRRPRDEDRRLANALLDHLNAHLEYYHRQIWLGMHPNRRYLLLDGFEAPNAGGRSVASVIENRVIGVAGNSLIFPVAPGVHLDPGTVIPPEAGGDLLAYYNADAPPPVRISVPTRGVYAEAIMGNCNSCEVKDDTRFWRWEQAPIPDKPAELGAVSMATRNQARSALRPDDFSTPIVKYQDAGNLPQGNGFQAALNLIGTPNLFRDLMGVDTNIQASSTALGAAFTAAQAFGGEAAKLAQQRYVAQNADRILATIKKAKDMKLLPDDKAAELTARTLDASVGKDDQKQDPLQIPEIKKLFERVQNSDNGSAQVSNDAGSVSLNKGTDPNAVGYQFAVDPPLSLIEQTSDAVCWAAAGAMLMNWRDGGKRTLAQAASDLGGEWRAKLDANSPLSAAELRGYAKAIGLVEDAAGIQYTARALLNVLRAYGPLWVIHDDFASDNKLVHARIVVGISGEGGGNQAMVKLLDPASSTPLEESFEAFAAHLTAPDPVRFAVGVLHFPAKSP